MQDLDKVIAENYNLDIASIVPFKDAYMVNSHKGKSIVRKTDLSRERIEFIHGAKEHLYNNGFSNLDRYLCTVEGNPYMEMDGFVYVMSEAVEGRECNFANREDVIKSTRALANLHKASKGYVQPAHIKSRDDLGKLPVYFGKRLGEIKKLKKIAKKGKSKFDYLFLKYVDYFYDLGERTIEELMTSKYEVVCEQTRAEGILCHHDYTHSNIICNDRGVNIINFEFCCFELRVYDIANLLRRKMRKCDWDINEARVIINEYQTVEKISKDEFQIMKLILQFPQKFWRVTNKFYNSKRSWSEKSYVIKLQEVLDELEPHKNFMEKYEMLVKNDEFG